MPDTQIKLELMRLIATPGIAPEVLIQNVEALFNYIKI